VGDAGEVEDRVVVGEGVEAGVVAEGAFAAEFAEFDVALEDDFGVGGDFEVDGFALDDFDGLPRRKPAIRNSSTSGGAGTMAENVVAGSVRWLRLLRDANL